jgi:hypothetical protein
LTFAREAEVRVGREVVLRDIFVKGARAWDLHWAIPSGWVTLWLNQKIDFWKSLGWYSPICFF